MRLKEIKEKILDEIRYGELNNDNGLLPTWLNKPEILHHAEYMKCFQDGVTCKRYTDAVIVKNIFKELEKVDVPDTNVGEWIPCSEPPKYTGDYLVTVGINRDGLGMYDEVRTANYNTFYEKWTVHEDWTNAIGTNPIAWMSLPPAYKEGDKK